MSSAPNAASLSCSDLAVIARIDVDGARQQHGTCIQARLHAHDGHAGDRVARQQGALNGRGAAPARQQRGMNVDAAEPGKPEHGGGKNQAVGDHNQRVDVRRAQQLHSLGEF